MEVRVINIGSTSITWGYRGYLVDDEEDIRDVLRCRQTPQWRPGHGGVENLITIGKMFQNQKYSKSRIS